MYGLARPLAAFSSLLRLPHSFHEFFLDEADHTRVAFLLEIGKIVAAVNVDGIELEITGAEPDYFAESLSPCPLSVPDPFCALLKFWHVISLHIYWTEARRHFVNLVDLLSNGADVAEI
jgi:hypothetical protein